MDSSTKPVFKRVKERSVQEAKESVDQWRKLFTQGLVDASGNRIKLTLQQAAEHVGIPKKTLEDYHQLLRKVDQITPIDELKDKKMGYLRKLLKDSKAQVKIEEEDIFEEEEKQQQMQELDPDYDKENHIEQEYHPQIEQIQQNQQQIDWEEMIIEGDVHFVDDWEDSLLKRRRSQQEQTQSYNPTPFVSLVLTPDLHLDLLHNDIYDKHRNLEDDRKVDLLNDYETEEDSDKEGED